MFENIDIFSSVVNFHTAFINGLDRALNSENLTPATFNLVFGNAILHHKEKDFLERLEAAKVRLAKNVDPNATDDDSVIFTKLNGMKLDWENWTMLEDRKINSWNILLNKFRILKPPGVSKDVITTLHLPFDNNGFNFNRVNDLTIWSGDIAGKNISLYFNKFPYKDLQALFVPDPAKNKEQFLTEEDHRFVVDMANSLSHLYNVSFGYNALGAGASVNHLHFHMMVGIEKLPVTETEWIHNGGNRPYPANVYVYSDAAESWKLIDKLNQQNIAYNVLYLPGKIYIFPRKFLGTYPEVPWSVGFSWMQFSGNFIVYDEDIVNTITEKNIVDALISASVKLEEQPSMEKFITVAKVADIRSDKPFCVEIEGKSLSIFKVGEEFFATTGVCTHAGGPICLGEIVNGVVTCPWHGSQFDVKDGKVVRGPAQDPLKTYKLRVAGDSLEIDIL